MLSRSFPWHRVDRAAIQMMESQDILTLDDSLSVGHAGGNTVDVGVVVHVAPVSFDVSIRLLGLETLEPGM